MVEMTLDMDISFQKHPPSTYEVKTGESYSRCREGSSSQTPPFISTQVVGRSAGVTVTAKSQKFSTGEVLYEGLWCRDSKTTRKSVGRKKSAKVARVEEDDEEDD